MKLWSCNKHWHQPGHCPVLSLRGAELGRPRSQARPRVFLKAHYFTRGQGWSRWCVNFPRGQWPAATLLFLSLISKGNWHSAGDKDCTLLGVPAMAQDTCGVWNGENMENKAVLALDSKDEALQGSYKHNKLLPELDWDKMALGS